MFYDLYDCQYGFLKNHSTEFAAMELTDKLPIYMDEWKITLPFVYGHN